MRQFPNSSLVVFKLIYLFMMGFPVGDNVLVRLERIALSVGESHPSHFCEDTRSNLSENLHEA